MCSAHFHARPSFTHAVLSAHSRSIGWPFTSPFWRTIGFDYAPNEVLTRLPQNFGADRNPWLYVKLREEAGAVVSLDKEFALFRESEKESTAKMMRQARVMKIVAGVVAVIVFIMVIAWAFMFVKVQKRLPGH